MRTQLPDRAPGAAPAALMTRLVPAPVATAETREPAAEDALFAEEAQALARATPRRRSEFAAGRACARRALRMLGMAPQAIPVGARGEPRWPAGVLGSITHCAGLRAAALARTSDVAALGIDAEPHAPLPPRLLGRIASERELAAIRDVAREHPEHPEVALDRLIFSAKEAVYKAWFPLTGRPLAFRDIELSIDPSRGELRARLLVDAPLIEGREVAALSGRWRADDAFLCVAIVLAGAGMRLRAPLGHPDAVPLGDPDAVVRAREIAQWVDPPARAERG
jgi:4'-phosphopantetheinyl transferase EntD